MSARALHIVGRVIAWGALSLVLLVGTVLTGAWLAARSDWGHRKLLAVILPRAEQAIDGKLRVGRFSGDIVRGLVLEHIEIDDREGQPTVRADRVALSYHLLPLVRKTLIVERATIDGLWVDARYLDDGRLNLATLLRPSDKPDAPPSRHPFKVILRRVVADARLGYEPARDATGALARKASADLHLDGNVRLEGPRIDVQLDAFSLATELPLVARLSLRGGARIDGAAISLGKVAASLEADGEQLAKVAPGVALQGPFALAVNADGALADLDVHVVLRPPRGTLKVDGKLAMAASSPTGALRWSAKVEANEVDPGAAVRDVPSGSIDLLADGEGDAKTGHVRLGKLEVDALGAHASAHGDSDLAGYGEAEVSVDARDLSRLAAVGVKGLGGALAAHANLARSESPEGHWKVDAELRGTRLRRDALRLASVRAEVHAADFLGDARLEAQGLRAASQRVDTMHLTAHVGRRALGLHFDAHGPSQLAAWLELDGKPLWTGARIAGMDAAIRRFAVARNGQQWSNRGGARLRVDKAIALENFVLASGTQQVALDARYALEPATLTAHLAAHALDVGALLALAQPAQKKMPLTLVDADVRVDGPMSRLVADAKVNAVARHVENLDRVDLRAEAHYQAHEQTRRVRGQLVLGAAKSSLNGRFDVPLATTPDSAPIALDLSLKGTELSSLRQLLPARLAALEGALDASIHAGGTLAAPRLEARLHASGWQLGWADKRDLESKNDTVLSVDYAAGKLSLHEATKMGVGAGRLDVDAALPVDARRLLQDPRRAIAELERTAPLVASLRAEHVDLARLPFEAAGMTRPVTAGVVDAGLKIDGTLRAPSVHATVQARGVAKEGVVDGVDAKLALDLVERVARATVQMDLRGQRLLDGSGQSPIDVGRVLDGQSMKRTPVVMEVTIPSYDLARLRGMQPQLDTLEGKLDGKVHVKGDLGRPTAQAELAMTGLRLDDTRFDKVGLTGDVEGGGARVAFAAHQVKGGSLELSALVPPGASDPWKIALKTQQLDLGFLAGALSSLRKTSGKLETDVAIVGSRAQPQVEGQVRLVDTAFQLRVDPHRYDKIELDARVHQGALRLVNFSASSGDGTLKATGEGTLDGFVPTRFELRADTHKFALVFGTLAAWLDSAIAVHAEGNGKKLKARIEVAKGMVRLPKIASARKLQTIGEPPRVTFVDAQARAEASKQAAAKRGEEGQTEVSLRIPGPFYIRSKEANAELQGDLQVTMRGSEVSLAGTAETNTGWIDLMGQRYTIERARVAFAGPPANPDLDVRITRQLTEAALVVEVHGTANKPRLDLFSDPPIYDKSQLLGILFSGDPANQRVSDRSLDQKVVGAVSGLVLGKLKDAIAPKLPIDLIHVETGSSGYTGLAQTRVEVGKYVTANLYVSYVHQFGHAAADTITNSNEAHVEYRFNRRYQVDTSFGDAGAAAVDLYWTIRY